MWGRYEWRASRRAVYQPVRRLHRAVIFVCFDPEVVTHERGGVLGRVDGVYGAIEAQKSAGSLHVHVQVFVQCLLIASWALEANPECEVFCENVLFCRLQCLTEGTMSLAQKCNPP